MLPKHDEFTSFDIGCNVNALDEILSFRPNAGTKTHEFTKFIMSRMRDGISRCIEHRFMDFDEDLSPEPEYLLETVCNEEGFYYRRFNTFAFVKSLLTEGDENYKKALFIQHEPLIYIKHHIFSGAFVSADGFKRLIQNILKLIRDAFNDYDHLVIFCLQRMYEPSIIEQEMIPFVRKMPYFVKLIAELNNLLNRTKKRHMSEWGHIFKDISVIQFNEEGMIV